MLDLLAAAGSSILGYLGQKDTNSTNMRLGREQMEFQERMSNTAYQRAMEDMRLAGLNPMLAAKVGGASSPAGAMPQVENAVSVGMSSAQQALGMAQTVQQVKMSQAQTEKIMAEKAKIESETYDKDFNKTVVEQLNELRRSQASLSGQKQLTEIQENDLRAINRRIRELELQLRTDTFSADRARRIAESELIQSDIPRMEANEKFWRDMGPAGQYLRLLLDALSGASSARRLMR